MLRVRPLKQIRRMYVHWYVRTYMYVRTFYAICRTYILRDVGTYILRNRYMYVHLTHFNQLVACTGIYAMFWHVH